MKFISKTCFIALSCLITSADAKPVITNYIVIGGGTAGAVVANRLSTSNHVILIHNGSNQTTNPLVALTENAFVTVPLSLVGAPFYQTGSSIPQPNLDNRQLDWCVAVPLGGASSINGSGYVRGTSTNYNQWATLNGPLWSYNVATNRIAQIFNRLESYHGVTSNPAVHGYHGPLNIYQVPNPTRVAQVFNSAINAAFFAPITNVIDYNDPATPVGSSAQMQFTASGANGQFRASSATAFLNPSVIDGHGDGVFGHHLQVYYDSTALKVIIRNNKAVGVEYYHRGSIKQVYANKGIIISAGLKSSPLLMHSGIGPANLLRSLGIPVVYHNPNVGQNLIDDAFVILGYFSNPNDTPVNVNSPVLTPLKTALLELTKSPFARELLRSLLIPNLTQISVEHGIFKQIAFFPEPGGPAHIRQILFSTINPIPGITLALFYIVQPTSRGSVSINSRNPLAPPVINFGMLSARDLDLFVSGMQTYLPGINNQLALIDPQYQLFWPDPAILSDPVLTAVFVQATVVNSMHFQGHCRMAPLNQGGVVDNHGRVYGVTNLYVADNSIVPFPMDGTPMASAYMIGENISQIILGR